MKDLIKNAINDAGFNIIHTVEQPARPAQFASLDDMNISNNNKDFMRNYGITQLWKHQRKAIETALTGKNVCISTSTSSGKTEIFQMIAIDILEKDPNAKVLALYSAKALNTQQRGRWENTGFKVGQIDGSDTNVSNRLRILRTSRVVVMTPDVMHTFLMGKLSDGNCFSTLSEFIKNVSLIIIDEIHLYRGVFGTNSAYLFRRFNNARRVLRKDHSYPLYVTASATLPNPGEHSENITGAGPFVNIGKEEDGTPMSKTHFFYISPSLEQRDRHTRASVSDLTLKLSNHEEIKSITFVESRQKTGEVVLGIHRNQEEMLQNLQEHQIYPYRAGMEQMTRETILNKMQTGEFKGIVSTSALEIGIDIDGLNVAIIANIPYDRNSYYQRIGRVGRGSCQESFVIVVNDGSFKAQLLFSECDFNIDNLLADLEPSLYLDSKNVQYVHATCHSDFDKSCCELSACGCNQFDESSRPYFADSFSKVCQQIADHQTTRDYDEYADIENPHYFYSIRNNSAHYSFQDREGNEIPDENVDRQQMLKEAYVGAIRNITEPINGKVVVHNQEILRIDKSARVITVRNFPYINIKSKPISNTLVYPNFSQDRRIKTASCNDTLFYNLELYEKIKIRGYKRIKGNVVEDRLYNRPFVDTLRTTGTIMFHPALQHARVRLDHISRLIFEAFLTRNAFDRNDINFHYGKLYVPNDSENLKVDDKFIALYDVNQLNITSNLLKENILKDIFDYLLKHMIPFANYLFEHGINSETASALSQICEDVIKGDLLDEQCATTNSYMQVYAPGTRALFYPNAQTEDENEEEVSSETECHTCVVMAPLKIDTPRRVVYVILDAVTGTTLPEVSEEQLRKTEETKYANFDWDSGRLIN